MEFQRFFNISNATPKIILYSPQNISNPKLISILDQRERRLRIITYLIENGGRKLRLENFSLQKRCGLLLHLVKCKIGTKDRRNESCFYGAKRDYEVRW